MEIDKIVHFASGEVMCEVSRANAGLVERDMRNAQRAREALREIPIEELIAMMKKAGPQEPWTPYRMTQAFIQAGVPKQAIAIYPGLGDVGAAVLAGCQRSLIFGGTATVEQY